MVAPSFVGARREPVIRNINSLNFLLRRVRTTQDLVSAYDEHTPGVINTASSLSPREQLNSCGGAAQFVVNYLTGSRTVFDLTERHQTRFNLNTVAELYARFEHHPGPYVGVLNALSLSHVCVFTRTGTQWAFYQANHTVPRENFTLAPYLNPGLTNWCINDMDQAQFRSLFFGLTTRGYVERIFPYKKPPIDWMLSVFSFSGQDLLA